MQTRAGHYSEQDDLDLSQQYPRSPSRVGYMRPHLRRQHAFTSLDWVQNCDSSDDEDGWGFAGTLLIPFQCSSSDESDISDEGSDTESLTEPMLQHTAFKLVESSAAVPADEKKVACVTATASDEDEPYLALTVTDHGHSRSALSHLKEFWHSRFDEYAKLEAQTIQNTAYGGIVEVNRSRDALRALLSRLTRVPNTPPAPPEAPQPLLPSANPNAPIYPRIGDLSSLHDSRSATLDRAFCNYPLYSINKILFLHDMLQRSTDPHILPNYSSSEHNYHHASPLPPRNNDAFVDVSLSEFHSHSSASLLAATTCTLQSTPSCQSNRCDSNENGPPNASGSAREWEIDWTARWRVLLRSTKDSALCLRRSSQYAPAVDEAAFHAALTPERPRTPKFFFAEDDDEFSGLNDDDDDGDDDYGHVVDSPMYGLSAETLSKEFLRTFDYQSAL